VSQDPFSAQKPPDIVPFSDRRERTSSAIGAIYDRFTQDEPHDPTRELEAVQEALDVLDQSDAIVASDRSSKTVGDWVS
jgi:hypothetical protein